jgi:DNA-binding MarR family transcriptional regulator
MQSGSDEPSEQSDHVDRVLALWAGEAPELDLATVGVIARLGRVRAYIDRQLDETLGEYGLTRQSWDVLASLRRVGPPYRLTPTDLYQAVMRTSGAITHTLHGLEHAGLISREPNPDDKRSLHVQLTEAGRELTARVAPEHLANEHRILAPLDQQDRDTLAGLLRRLLIGFEREHPTPHAATGKPRPRRGTSGD